MTDQRNGSFSNAGVRICYKIETIRDDTARKTAGLATDKIQ